ncbi:hypothetical protein AALB39_04440 [Lachnospiraceae bacterium 54-53]
MAIGAKTKEELTIEAINEPKQIDTSVDIKIPRSKMLFDSSKHKFKCSCCGKGFTVQKSNFHKSESPLFQENNGYLPWCKNCTDLYWYGLVNLYSGNEAHATEDFCHTAGWVFDSGALMAAKKISSDRSRISGYSAKKNLNVGDKKTYIDTIKTEYESKLGEVVSSKEQLKNSDFSISASAVDRWGIGFAEADYKNLDEHYRMLKKNNPNADNNQEIFIKSLCNLNMLMIRALKAGDSKEYSNLVEQYSKTFKQAGLRTVEEKDGSNDECLGVTLAAIAQYTPEEYYKDKNLYKDFDNIGDYFDRFVKRPLKNLMFGSNERDKEYYVKDGGDLDE